MFDTVITGAAAVLERTLQKSDIFISGGKIAAVKPHLKSTPKAARVIDASGKFALPGIIDPHVHFNLPVGEITTSDDFSSGSRAAIAGGVTTVIDYAQGGRETPLAEGVAQRLSLMRGKMSCDYAVHCVIPAWKMLKNPAAQVKELCRDGITSFKMFMIYAERGMMADDADIFEALEASKECGALICLHAESDAILHHFINKYKGRGAVGHSLSRPAVTEWESVQRAITWAGETKAHIYFVHLSAGHSAELVESARKAGIKAMGETCPQYLTLDDSIFRRKNGHYYATCPQVKTKRDSAILWRELALGAVSNIATDSCTFNTAQKNRWGGDFTKIPFGIPGVETSLPLVYTNGVLKKRISILQLSHFMSLNPAKIMGLYPRKGTLRPGADADIVLIDPAVEKAVDYKNLQTNCDWSPYQGMKLKGWAQTVLLRGEIAAQNGIPAKSPGGQFVKRNKTTFL
jgi:dihydropyrimidinase